MKNENILGFNVVSSGKEELMEAVRNDIGSRTQRLIVAINPEKILLARKDEKLAQILRIVDYPIPDGVGILWASKLQKGSIKQRITGIDCMEMLCAKAAEFGWRVFLYGAKPGVADIAGNALVKKYPALIIAGTANGYGNDNQALIEQINASNADILFVALGSPAQENWILQNRNKLSVKVFQGVGGSFDVFCGNIKRAPKWMQKCGLEWFYRLLKQPKRIIRQSKMIVFLFLILGNRKYEN